MRNTQLSRVKEILVRQGFVTNVWAVTNHILRLGALIHKLRESGWVIEGNFLDHSKNYKYTFVSQPKKIHPRIVLKEDGTRVAVYD